jgi:hypothetical protein
VLLQRRSGPQSPAPDEWMGPALIHPSRLSTLWTMTSFHSARSQVPAVRRLRPRRRAGSRYVHLIQTALRRMQRSAVHDELLSS